METCEGGTRGIIRIECQEKAWVGVVWGVQIAMNAAAQHRISRKPDSSSEVSLFCFIVVYWVFLMSMGFQAFNTFFESQCSSSY